MIRSNQFKISILFSLILFVFSEFTPQIQTMKKIHPVSMKRNIAIRDAMETPSETSAQKRLRRLPHVFGKVLELPFRSDADVSVEETDDFFRFVAQTDESIGDDVRAHAVEIHPGVTKIVVRNGGGGGEVVELLLGALEVDAWRFRLPAMTLPEMASAVFVDGELIVTVPKSGDFAGGEGLGGVRRLVLVQ
ncbi:hypothetical protein ACSBR2_031119 [Camellia fascicularis]